METLTLKGYPLDLENSSSLHADNGLVLELLHAAINTTLILKESFNPVLKVVFTNIFKLSLTFAAVPKVNLGLRHHPCL